MQIGPEKEKLFLDLWHFNSTVTQFRGFHLLAEDVFGCENWRNPYWKTIVLPTRLWAIYLKRL